MLRKIAFILCFLGILAQTTSQLIILVNFKMNQDFIAKNECINRTQINSCCKGKCQLNKKLSAEEENRNPTKGSNILEKIENLPGIITDTQLHSVSAHSLLYKHYFSYKINYCLVTENTIFHPPPSPFIC